MLWKLSSCCSWSVLRSQLTSCSTAASLQKCSSGFSLATSSGTICFGSLCVELLRRVRKEFTVELPFLRKKWKWLVCGVLFQYCHGIFTTLAYRLHHPQPQPLYDLGFQLTPELGERNKWVSEIIFGTLFAGLILWTLSPFVLHGQRFYTVVLYSRLLQVLVACQSLRIISFLSTSLPGPNYHCREGRSTSHLDWPSNWWEHVVIDVKRQSTHSCGDLIFSSHTTFVLTFVLAFHEYGQSFPLRCLAWAGAVTLSFLIICSRKHYTVDVVIAWYVVPLVFYTLKRRWTTMRPSVVGDHVEYDVEALTPSDPSTPSAVVLGELQHHGGVTSATTLLSNGISGASSSGSHSPSSVLVELAVASPQCPGAGSDAKPAAQGMAGSSPGSLSRIRSQQTLSSAGGITSADTLPSHLRMPASNHRRNASGTTHHAISGCQIA